MAGKYYEELTVGQVFQHQPGRTVTEADNVWFSCLTMNPQPLHVDFHAAEKAEFGKPLVNSLFTLGVAVGLSVGETTLGTTVGNLGFEKVEFPKPVFHGDTIYSETEVVDKRESRSRPQWGIVTFVHRARNQHDEVVMVARPRRSLHFVPGGNDRMLAKALTLPADGLILDLEDAVAPDRKAVTRGAVGEWLGRDFGGRERWVRMNPIATGHGRADLEATIAARPDGYVVPKP